MSSKFPVNRRTVLRNGLWLAGGAAIVGPFGALLSACGSDDESEDTSAPETSAPSAATTAAGAATTAAGSTPMTSAAGAMTTLSYQLSWLPTVEHCGTYIGIEDGIFAELGLDVKVINGGPNAQTVPTVVSGTALVGSDGSDNVGSAVKEGAKIKVFGARFQKNPLCVVSLSGSPITTPEELIGKKIGVAQGNLAPWEVFLKRAGIDAGDVTVVPVQFDPSPVANGEVDGQVVFSINEPQQLKVKGIDTEVMLFADYGFSIYAGCYFALEETIAEQPDVLAAFLQGEREAFLKNFADPTLGTKYTMEIYGRDQGFDAAQQQFESEVLESVMVTPYTEANGLLSMDPADIAANVETLGVAGIEVTPDLFTTEILEML